VILGSQIWTDVFWTSVVAGGLLAGIPLMFTALGETISEQAGVLNIGLEGMMLLGAYVGFLGAYYGGSSWVGFLSGVGCLVGRLDGALGFLGRVAGGVAACRKRARASSGDRARPTCSCGDRTTDPTVHRNGGRCRPRRRQRARQ